MIQLKYRSDIDGLRAVAVLGVVIYHAFPSIIPGGFIGVDIFFVISGYLISGILYKGHNAGNFSFKEFYARRIRRLFPALITVLLLCLAYGWLILLPDEFQQLGKHVAAGTLFIQNFIFWQESGYFDTAANLKSLLHLWSLAVEEQFYIFFPPLLILFWKKPKLLIPAMVVLMIATFILNVVMSIQNNTTDFFLTPYRAWEFLGGSLLAWWHYDKNHEEDVPLHRNALSWIGLILLGLGMVFIHTEDPYPGWRALLPVAGTLMLMEGGAGGLKGAWVNQKILSNPAVVWIGLISYPLYLFHWPALSFVHIVKGESPNPGCILTALGVSMILTILTYYFIEKKIRHNKSRYILTLLVLAFITMGGIGFLVWQQWLPSAHLGQDLIKVSAAIKDNGIQEKFTIYPGTQFSKILRIGGSGAQTIFLGDSHMQQYAPRISHLLLQNNSVSRGAIFTAAPASLPVDGLINPNWNNGKDLMFSFWNEIKKNPNIDRVVICARWGGGYFDHDSTCIYNGLKCSDPKAFDAVMGKFKEEIQSIKNNNKKVYIILDTPTGDELHPRNFCVRSFYSPNNHSPKEVKIDAFMKKDKLYRKRLIEIARETGSEIIDPLPYLTLGKLCLIANQDGPIRCDESHLRPGYVKDHAIWIDQTVAP